MIKIYNKYFSIKILFWALIASFLVSACEDSLYSILSINSRIYYEENNISNIIQENDSLSFSELKLTINIENEYLENNKLCIHKFLNPIGALMALTIPNKWCANSAEILIISNNDFNGVPAGNSLNHFFQSDSNQSIDEYVSSFIKEEYLDEVNTVLYINCKTKPILPQQKFYVTLTTDKGIYNSETVNFYWE